MNRWEAVERLTNEGRLPSGYGSMSTWELIRLASEIPVESDSDEPSDLEWEVYLKDAGGVKISCIKVIREAIIGLGLKDAKELVALAKAKPGALSFGSSGIGAAAHLTTELLMLTTGIKLNHVPYKGTAPALQDLVGGQIQILMGIDPVGSSSAEFDKFLRNEVAKWAKVIKEAGVKIEG